MNKKFIRFSALALFFAMGAFAQEQEPQNLDEVVVSDSKFALAKEKSGKVIVKITAEDLKKRAGQSVAAILSTVAGVEINGNQSRMGKDLGLYIRGGRNHQVLIMIDGVPVTDASGISLSYDLRLLPVEQIESIEILKGASSTLYGSGAATGVINITLKKAAKKEIAGNAYVNMGSQTAAKIVDYSLQDFNQGIAVNGTSKKFSYFTALNSTETTGISEARPASNTEVFENDAFSRVNAVVKVGFKANEAFSLDFFSNYDRLKSDFDSGSFADNKDNFSVSEQFRVGFAPKLKYAKGELVLNASAGLIERGIFNFGSLSNYKSRNVNADLFNKYNFSSEFFLVTGAQFQFHEMSNESQFAVIPTELAKFNMIDPYFTLVYNAEFGLNVNAGARYNMHNEYGNNLVYNFNPSYNVSSNFKVLASFSTAFVTPSLYQLYSEYGKLDLAPEKDATAELGFETSILNKKLVLNAVAFQREEEDAIGFDLIDYKYFNVLGKNKARGLETMVSYAFSDKLKAAANYTFTELERQSRILNPKHKVNATLDYQASSRLAFNMVYQFVSDRVFEYTTYPAPTFDPVLNSEILKDYQLVHANARYDLLKNRLQVFGAVDNIFDRDFVETRGYSTRGRNFKVGLNFLF